MTSKEQPKRSATALVENSLDLVARYCSDMDRRYPTRISYLRVGEALTNLYNFIEKHKREQSQPTLEECIKEWKELGWRWKQVGGFYYVTNKDSEDIEFNQVRKCCIICEEIEISIELIELIHKTLKALEKINNENT